ncbi:histidine kinase dimerization/phospho-acceptor domain-containing protein [Paraburkholderia sp. BR10954]|uniref:histidine kinase dimerization/phospho-acceptor domain-containing protein n=1 Tax=Paraburkholderia sp. BR10954 TaxID=3236995 RepID=UPI0034D357DD
MNANVQLNMRNKDERKRADPFVLLGQLSAYIGHEVNQPLGAIVAHGEACLRWLNRETPAYEEATASVQNIIGLGQRASEIVQSICSLATPSALQATRLELNDLVHDVIPLVGHDVSNHRVSLRRFSSTSS